MRLIKTVKIGYIIISALFCLLGLVFIIHPSFTVGFIGALCGIALIIFGIAKLAGYFSGDLYRSVFHFDLAAGLLSALLGIMMVINPQGLMNIICVILGISVLSEGLFKIQAAIDSKRAGIGHWQLILILAVVAVIAGFVLMLRPAESGELLTVIMGISLLSEGIMNLITVITAVKIEKEQPPQVIEVKAEIED